MKNFIVAIYKFLYLLLIFTLSSCSSNSASNKDTDADFTIDNSQTVDLVALKDQFYSFSFSLLDVNNSAIISIDNSTPTDWLIVNNIQNTISGTPTENDLGVNTIKLNVVEDNKEKTQEITISVIDNIDLDIDLDNDTTNDVIDEITGDIFGTFYDTSADDTGTIISGQLTHFDADSNDANNIFIPSSDSTKEYGSFKFTSDGSWTYTAKSAINQLQLLENRTETFTIQTLDGTIKHVVITLNGVNDSPKLTIESTIESIHIHQVLSLTVEDPENDSLNIVFINSPTLLTASFNDLDTLSFKPIGETGNDNNISFKFIDSNNGESNIYTINIAILATLFVEANDNISRVSAQSIFQNSTIDASIEPLSTGDWFTFDAFSDGSVELLLTHSTANDLELFTIEITNAEGQIVSNTLSLDDDRFLFPVSAGETYFIKVTPSETFGNNNRAYSLFSEYYSSKVHTLSWLAPSAFEDGATLNVQPDLAQYNLYYGTEVQNINKLIMSFDVASNGVNTTSLPLANLRFNKAYHFTMTAESNGIESIQSLPVSMTPTE